MANDKYTAVWISNSSINDFIKCPRAYFLHNIYKNPSTRRKINIVNSAFSLGHAVHATLEGLKNISVEERMKRNLLSDFENEWEKVTGLKGGFINKDEEEIAKARGKAMIERVIKNPGPIAQKTVSIPIMEDHMPPHFFLSEKENIILCGFIDWAELIEKNNTIRIIDFKTGKHDENEDSFQLPIYVLLLNALQKRQVSSTAYWYLDRDDTLSEVPFPDIENAKDKILKIALQIKEARLKKVFDCPNGKEGCYVCKPFEAILRDEAKYIGVDSFNRDTYLPTYYREFFNSTTTGNYRPEQIKTENKTPAIQNSITKKKKNDLQKMNLYGKVKSVKTIAYETIEKFGEITKGKRIGGHMWWWGIADEYIFNEWGNRIEMNRYGYDPNGNLDWKFTCKYDDRGNEIEGNWYKSDGSIDKKTTYMYDEKGNMIANNTYKSDGSIDKKTTYMYDEKGNMIANNTYKSDGSIDKKSTCKYDGMGNMVEENFYNSNKIFIEKWTWKYDGKGEKTEWNKYRSDGILNRKVIYKYDDIGNMIKENGYDSNGNLDAEYIYKYDDKGNMIESIEDNDGSWYSVHKRYTHEFDDQKNWIKEIGSSYKGHEYIAERVIEYYL